MFEISFETSSINFAKSIAFLDVITGLPVSFSISFLAFPAIDPPSFATFLFSSKTCGFFVFVSSVVVASEAY